MPGALALRWGQGWGLGARPRARPPQPVDKLCTTLLWAAGHWRKCGALSSSNKLKRAPGSLGKRVDRCDALGFCSFWQIPGISPIDPAGEMMRWETICYSLAAACRELRGRLSPRGWCGGEMWSGLQGPSGCLATQPHAQAPGD